MNFKELFNVSKPIIGMVHVGALPGTPRYKGDINKIIEKAIDEAKIYLDSGINSIAIENMHDLPYLNRNVGPEIISMMSIIAYEVKNKTNLPIGLQILAGANKEALACAKSAGIDFIRAEGFVFAHVADEGLINSDAGELLRYRKMIDADNILVFTDIKKKHSSHNLTSDVSIELQREKKPI
jgi:membrane complex biogenesis BtpA family protein